MGQEQLDEHTRRRRLRVVKVEPSPLAGKLFDSSGAGLTASHARKGERQKLRAEPGVLSVRGAPERAG
jgi:hypothetical protein